MYTGSFKSQTHFKPNFEKDFPKEKKESENAAINNTAKIFAPNNHLSGRLDLFCLKVVLYLDRDHSQRAIL